MPAALKDATPVTGASSEFLDDAAAVIEQHFDTPFSFFDPGSLRPFATSRPCEGLVKRREITAALAQTIETGAVVVAPISDAVQALLIPFGRGRRPEFVAVGVFGVRPLTTADEEAAARPWLGSDLSPGRSEYCQPELLWRFGVTVQAAVMDKRRLSSREREIRQLAAQVTRNFEEITLLHRLAREAQVSRGTRAVQEMTLTLLADVLPTRQIVYVEPSGETLLIRGDTIWQPSECVAFARQLGSPTTMRAIVDNRVATEPWARYYPAVERLIAVPVIEEGRVTGWLLALDTTDGSELGSVEASLMTAVAAILATHHTNVELFRNVEDLFLGAVRALSSAVDAKDTYTCGHSERVAHVAKRLALQLGLPERELDAIYLSGLLHDVGKIGIRDSVLLKRGRLTPEEFEHMKEHPRIGFDILSGVRQLKSVLPGVRNHHENFDGTGYPDRLAGEAIPLMARIIAVADAYDAMSSTRPYRETMAAEQVTKILHDGAGKQWDTNVIAAFFAILDTIRSELADERLARGNQETSTPRGALSRSDVRAITKSFALSAAEPRSDSMLPAEQPSLILT